MNLPTGDQTYVMPLDVEHVGIRLGLPILAVVGFIAGYAITLGLTSAIQAEAPSGCLAVIVGVIASIASILLGDYSFKRFWPSHRTLLVDQEGLRMRDERRGRRRELRIEWDRRINPLAWRFSVKRGSARVPKGWIMLGLQLLQDEQLLTLYAFLSPQEAEALPIYEHFTLLLSRSIDTSQMNVRLQAEQRRLLKAEDERWRDGAEVRHDDFLILVDIITRRLPAWQTGVTGGSR